MNSAACTPALELRLARPWWRRLLDAWPRRMRPELALYRELRHLDEHTLRDIGAPAWVHERELWAERWLLDARRQR